MLQHAAGSSRCCCGKGSSVRSRSLSAPRNGVTVAAAAAAAGPAAAAVQRQAQQQAPHSGAALAFDPLRSHRRRRAASLVARAAEPVDL